MDFARSAHPGVQAQLDRLSKLSPTGDRLGLDRIRALLERLGNPQDRLPPVLHVAGTNGKGSTVAFLRAALEATGRIVHVFTSPHLVRFNERIRIAGYLIDDDALESRLAHVIDAGYGIEPSFFEVAAAVAITAFAETPADACILEVGLGGRLDATNVIDQPLICGIASIGLDHQHFLGTTLSSIAVEKASIAKAGVPLVSLAQPADAEQAIIATAEAAGAPLLLEGRDWQIDRDFASPVLRGFHQVRNANLAYQMLRASGHFQIGRDAMLTALKTVQWPGRFHRLGDGPLTRGGETWVDGAHNDDSASALASLLAEHGPMHLVIGVLANKDADEIVGMLAQHALSLTFVPVPEHEHHSPDELAVRFSGRTASSLEDALHHRHLVLPEACDRRQLRLTNEIEGAGQQHGGGARVRHRPHRVRARKLQVVRG
jgi:dihydrofolate synthase/folylpolyglutamate synthase